MRICLFQPPASYNNPNCCLPTDYVGLGLLALEAYLRQQGVEVLLVQASLALQQGMAVSEIFNKVKVFRPDLAAVSINWLHLSRGALETAKGLKAILPDLPVIFGGQHASLFADEIIGNYGHLADAVILGEAEVPLRRIGEALSAGQPWHDIPGVVSARPRKTALDAGASEVIDAVDLLPLIEHQRIWPPYQRPLLALSTQRGGCERFCNFCLEARDGATWKRQRPVLHGVERLLDQIALSQSEGLDVVTIEDPFFLRGDESLKQVVQGLVARGIGLHELNFFTEPGCLSSAGLTALAAAGAQAVSVDFGVETGSPEVAGLLGRSLDREALLGTLEACVSAGVMPYTWWMVGLPGEGPEELAQTESLLLETMRIGAVPRWVTPLVLFPQTPLYRRRRELGIRPRMTLFRHFARYSEQKCNATGDYPALITHETSLLNQEQVARAAQHLKQVVLKHWSELCRLYQRNPQLQHQWDRKTSMLTKSLSPEFNLNSFF